MASLHRAQGTGQYRANETHVAVADRLYRFGTTRPGVIFCHAINGNAATALPTHLVLDILAAAGYPCLSVDLGGLATWGNDTAQTALGEAKTYLQGTLKAKAGGVFLYGVSMGSLAALNYMFNNPTHILGAAVQIPAIDLADIHDNNRGGYTSSIETAYTDQAGYNAAIGTHNPATRAASYDGTKIKLWYASDDPICVPSTATSFAASSGAAIVNMGTGGHQPQPIGANVLAFFDSLGGRS